MPMENGQGDDAPGTTDDLAQFLVDNPEADEGEGAPPADEARDADNPDDVPDDSQADDDEDTPHGDDDDADAAKPTSGQKFKVSIKGEDGADTEIEVDAKELVAGYQRHADYTRKTQELGTQRDEVLKIAETRINEGRNYYVQQATAARQAIVALAGLKSPEEMAALAQHSPGEWAAEKARTEQIMGVLAQIDQGMQADQQRMTEQQKQEAQRAMSAAWGTLGQEGIDKPKLLKIFEGVHEAYGVPKERFANVSDPKLVLIMRDAMKFRELQARSKTLQPRVAAAPKPPIPAARARVPASEKANVTLNKRFKTGTAKSTDLAAWIANNNL